MGKGFLVIDPFLMNNSISSMGERKKWRKRKEINYKKVERLSVRSGENYENFRVMEKEKIRKDRGNVVYTERNQKFGKNNILIL